MFDLQSKDVVQWQSPVINSISSVMCVVLAHHTQARDKNNFSLATIYMYLFLIALFMLCISKMSIKLWIVKYPLVDYGDAYMTNIFANHGYCDSWAKKSKFSQFWAPWKEEKKRPKDKPMGCA